MVNIDGSRSAISACILLLLAALASALLGCTPIRYEQVVAWDESHGKFKITNTGGYLVELSGPKQIHGVQLVPSKFISETTMSKDTVYGHFRCKGNFRTVAHFSKIIGKTASGDLITEFMGEATFFIHIDWINSEYGGESLDSRYLLSGFSPPPPNRFVQKTHIVPYNACGVGSIFIPTISIEPVR